MLRLNQSRFECLFYYLLFMLILGLLIFQIYIFTRKCDFWNPHAYVWLPNKRMSMETRATLFSSRLVIHKHMLKITLTNKEIINSHLLLETRVCLQQLKWQKDEAPFPQPTPSIQRVKGDDFHCLLLKETTDIWSDQDVVPHLPRMHIH